VSGGNVGTEVGRYVGRQVGRNTHTSMYITQRMLCPKCRPYADTSVTNPRCMTAYDTRFVAMYRCPTRINHILSSKKYQDTSGGKDGRCIRVTTLPPS
jgi:hypothetical protein